MPAEAKQVTSVNEVEPVEDSHEDETDILYHESGDPQLQPVGVMQD